MNLIKGDGLEPQDILLTCVECQVEFLFTVHDRLKRSLLTYRSHDTPAEQEEIDALVSDLGFHRAWHERVIR